MGITSETFHELRAHLFSLQDRLGVETKDFITHLSYMEAQLGQRVAEQEKEAVARVKYQQLAAELAGVASQKLVHEHTKLAVESAEAARDPFGG